MNKEVFVPSKLPRPLMPYAPAVKAGPFLFAAGAMATDFRQAIAPEAQVNPEFPYYGSPIKRQTDYILSSLKTLFDEAGSSMNDVLRIGTYHCNVDEMPGIAEVRRGYWPANPPASTAMGVAQLAIPAARLEIDAIAALPAGGARPDVIVDDRLARPAMFSQAKRLGGLVFAAGILASDFRTGLNDAAKVNMEFPYHVSPVKQQTRYILDAIGNLLQTAGTSLDQVVRALVILTDLRDLFAFEEVWREYFPTEPPARTLVEAGLAQTGCVVEVEVIAAVPSAGTHKEVVQVPGVPAPVGHESLATRAGSFVFTGGLLPTDGQSAIAPEARLHPNFPRGGFAVKKQAEYVIGNLRKILEAAGTALDNAVMVHAFHRNMSDLFPALEVRGAAFGANPPASTTVQLSNLPIPGALFMMDCFAVVP